MIRGWTRSRRKPPPRSTPSSFSRWWTRSSASASSASRSSRPRAIWRTPARRTGSRRGGDRRDPHRLGGDLGLRQAGHRARLGHRRHSAVLAETGFAYREPMITGRRGMARATTPARRSTSPPRSWSRRSWSARSIPGTLKLWPGVAEELVASKAYLVRAGVFKDVDVALFTHVANSLGVSWGAVGIDGLVSVEFKFKRRDRALRRRPVARQARSTP